MQRHREREKSTEWWESYFDAQYMLEYEPIFSPERDRHEAARVLDVLGLPDGSRVLDVPCGQGRHAHLLAEAGYNVDGLD
jgi:cyclopropane fatty-acyl-phospholipid synthase-like methyltransferase